MNPIKSLARLLGFGRQSMPSALTSLANRPMLMSQGALDAMLSGFNANAKPEAYREDSDFMPHGAKPEHLITIAGTVGILSISGPLFQRFGVDAWWWGGQGYDVIKAAHAQLVANPQVASIVFDLDSPGGQVSGCFDLVDYIASTRGAKPITAVINDTAASACYAIASAADRIVLSRTGTAGSIGVIATHLDMSGWLRNTGLAYTFVTSGEKKADFSTASPMSDRARGELQAEVDRLAGIFIATVAANRKLAPEAIFAMQAGCYFGQGAIDAGLADALGTLDDIVSSGVLDLPDVAPEEDQEDPQARAETAKALEFMSIRDAVFSSTLPGDLRLALMETDAKVSAENVQDRIKHAATVRDLCAAHGDQSKALPFVQKNVNIETVREQLLAMKSAGPELVTSAPADGSKKTSSVNVAETYAKRRKAKG